jgi:hypothetical protein
MSAEAAWVLGPFVFGAGVAIALGLFDIGSALRELLDRANLIAKEEDDDDGDIHGGSLGRGSAGVADAGSPLQR